MINTIIYKLYCIYGNKNWEDVLNCHENKQYLFGAVAGGEVCVAVPPAAFECLLCWAGVVVQQVLLQVLYHAKD